MLRFHEGWQLFWAGLNKRHIREYWVAVWGHAWEIWWGAGVIGTICTIVTIYYVPSRWILGWVIAWAFLVAGYYTWRPFHLRLSPQFKASNLGYQDTTAEDSTSIKGSRTFIQLWLECITDAPVYECVAYLKMVRRWHSGEWKAIDFDRNLMLKWTGEKGGFTQQPHAESPLNICFIEHFAPWIIRPCIRDDADIPLRKIIALFNQQVDGLRAYQFDIQVNYSDRIDGKFVSIATPVNVRVEVTFASPPYGNPFRPQLNFTELSP